MSADNAEEKRTLREWREARQLTPLELAAQAHVSLTTVLDIEQYRRTPTVITARKLVQVLGVTVDDVRWPEEDEIIRRPRPKSRAVAA